MKQKKSKTFESQLFQAMKSSGLLFPVSDRDVNHFEQDLFRTEMPLPVELQGSNSIISTTRQKNEPLFKMAAFSKKKTGKRKE